MTPIEEAKATLDAALARKATTKLEEARARRKAARMRVLKAGVAITAAKREESAAIEEWLEASRVFGALKEAQED